MSKVVRRDDGFYAFNSCRSEALTNGFLYFVERKHIMWKFRQPEKPTYDKEKHEKLRKEAEKRNNEWKEKSKKLYKLDEK
jgi:hypothetical protein